MDATKPLPAQINLHSQTLDITTPVFRQWLKLMQIMPLTIGDFLDHPDSSAFDPTDAVMAIHALIAFGIVAPMRNSFEGMGQADHHYPRLSGLYNQSLRGIPLQSTQIVLASPVAGRPVQMSLAEALVLQAVGRVGLAESANALMTELQRVAGNPALSASMFAAGITPAPDVAEQLIKQVCADHMVDWYALGILDAA